MKADVHAYNTGHGVDEGQITLTAQEEKRILAKMGRTAKLRVKRKGSKGVRKSNKDTNADTTTVSETTTRRYLDQIKYSAELPWEQYTYCSQCGTKAGKKCSQCGKVFYCSVECQRKGYPAHSKHCKSGNSISVEKLVSDIVNFIGIETSLWGSCGNALEIFAGYKCVKVLLPRESAAVTRTKNTSSPRKRIQAIEALSIQSLESLYSKCETEEERRSQATAVHRIASATSSAQLGRPYTMCFCMLVSDLVRNDLFEVTCHGRRVIGVRIAAFKFTSPSEDIIPVVAVSGGRRSQDPRLYRDNNGELRVIAALVVFEDKSLYVLDCESMSLGLCNSKEGVLTHQRPYYFGRIDTEGSHYEFVTFLDTVPIQEPFTRFMFMYRTWLLGGKCEQQQQQQQPE